MKSIVSLILALLLSIRIPQAPEEDIRAVWVTQFDIMHIFDNDTPAEATAHSCETAEKLKYIGCNTVFLQLHPNGDSICFSEIFPPSKYVTGAYGREISTDVAGTLIRELTSRGIKVFAWINPYRLMTTEEMGQIPEKYGIKKAFLAHDGSIREYEGRLYFDPSSSLARELTVAYAAEIMENLDVEGIVIDDYFYPTQDPSFDADAFEASGYTSLTDFRRDNITSLISALHECTASHGKRFIVSPAGNIYTLFDRYYLDISAWCENGYVDLVSPQIYFGYKNKFCPFDGVLRDWEAACGNVRIIPSLALIKSAKGYCDIYAGTEEGRNEWIEDKDVIFRQMRRCMTRYRGCALFSFDDISACDVDKLRNSW